MSILSSGLPNLVLPGVVGSTPTPTPSPVLPDFSGALLAYLDPINTASVTQSSGSVSNINSTSPATVPFFQATSAQQPPYNATAAFDGKAAILFNDGASYLTSAQSYGTSKTIFYLGVLRVNSGSSKWLIGADGTGGIGVAVTGGGALAVQRQAQATIFQTEDNLIIPGQPFLISFTFVSNGNLVVRFNGKNIGTVAAGTVVGTRAITLNYNINVGLGGSGPFSLYSFAVAEGVLSDDLIMRMESFMAWYRGLPNLIAGQLYRYAPPSAYAPAIAPANSGVFRSVSAYSSYPSNYIIQNNANAVQATVRKADVIAATTRTIRVLAGNPNIINGDVNTATVQQRHALEINGTTVPFTFGGQQLITLAPGDTLMSDPLYTSAFPALSGASFDRELNVYRRSDCIIPSGQTRFTYNDITVSNRNEQCVLGPIRDGAVLTGALVVPATDGFSRGELAGTALALVGDKVVGSPRSMFIVGSSTIAGAGDDSTVYTRAGTGPAKRSIFDQYGFNPLPTSIVGLNGQRCEIFNNNTLAKSSALLQLFEDFYNGFNTNDFQNDGSTGASIFTRYQSTWASAKAVGCKTLQNYVPPLTSSTDQWKTAINQAKTADFQSGGARQQCNALFTSVVGGSQLDAIFDYLALIQDPDGVDWLSDGVTAFLSTADGIHMRGTTIVTIGQRLRTYRGA